MIDIYELKATYLLTYQLLVPDGGTEPDVKTQNSDPPELAPFFAVPEVEIWRRSWSAGKFVPGSLCF